MCRDFVPMRLVHLEQVAFSMQSKVIVFSIAIILQCSYIEGVIPEVTSDGCSVSKTCFKTPSTCSNQNDCDSIVSWKRVDENGVSYVEFEAAGKIKNTVGYIAIGFTKTEGMGDAGVIGCEVSGSSSSISFKVGYNPAFYNEFVNSPSNNFTLTSGPGTQNLLGGYFLPSGQILVCRFRRLLVPSSDVAKLKDLTPPNAYYILVSRSDQTSTSRFPKHFASGKVISDSTFVVGSDQYTNVAKSGDQLIKAHGSLMLIAWLLCANIGIIMARYMKPMFPNKKLIGEKVWFQLHRTFQILCVLLTAISFIIIFVEIRGYSQLTTMPAQAHPVFGIIVMVLAILNPVIAIFRPHPGTANRPLFNWIHFLIGSLAQVFAVTAIFIGIKLDKVGSNFTTSPYPFWILVGYVIFIVVMEVLFAIDSHGLKKGVRSENVSLHHMRTDNAPGIQNNDLGKSSDMIVGNEQKLQVDGAPLNQIRRLILLALHSTGVVAFTIALVALLAMD